MKLYFSLPNFYENFDINRKLKNLIEQHPEWLLWEDVIFERQNGSFPNHSWNGGFNNCCNGLTAKYMDFIGCSNASNMVLNLNCSNIGLTQDDLNDAMSHTILECCQNGANTIEIADLQLKDFITKKYPLYEFILSKEMYWLNPNQYTPEILNQIIDLDLFKAIMVPEHLSANVDFLSQIKHKNRLCVAVNPKCPLNCQHYDLCHSNEHQLQLIYSRKNQIHSCSIRKSYQFTFNTNILDLKEKYSALGINHFYFTEVFAAQDLYNVINYYVHFFIKPEYHDKAFTVLLNSMEGQK